MNVAVQGLSPESRLEGADSEEFAVWNRDALSEALRDGRLTGTPVTGVWADALMEALARLGVSPDAKTLSAALPRYVTSFRRPDLVRTLERLGITVEPTSVRSRDLNRLPATSVIMDRDGSPAFLAAAPENGRSFARHPVTGRPCRPTRFQARYPVLVLRPEAEPGQTVSSGASASLAQRLRVQFGPELRLVVGTTLVSNILVIAVSLSIGFIFDAVLPAGAIDTLAALTIGVFGVAVFDFVLARIRGRMLAHISGQVDARTRSLTFSKLLDLPPDMIEAQPAFEQVERLRQFDGLRDQVAGPLLALYLEFPLSLIILAAMAVLSPKLAGVALVFAVALGLLALLLLPRLRVTRQRSQEAQTAHARLLREAIERRPQLLRQGLGPIWIDRLSRREAALQALRLEEDAAWRLMLATGATLTPLAIGSVVFMGALDAIEGTLSAGVLVACTVLSSRLFIPLQQALLALLRLPEIMSLVRQIDRMLALPQVSGSRANIPPTLPEQNSPLMTLESVVLRYSGARMATFAGLKWQVPKGTLAAVTGASGSGKTSLLMLLCGRVQPISGMVRIAGQNIAQIDPETRASLIGCAGPSSAPLSASIAANLRLRRPDASLDELKEICRELLLDRDIESLEGDLDARIGIDIEAHLTPSFRTRLALARLLLAPPALLLLDQPETGLSNDEEHAIIAAIRRRQPDLTCVMVTQRPAMMRVADAVFELTPHSLIRRPPASDKEV